MYKTIYIKLCSIEREPLQSINQYHNTIKRYKVKQSIQAIQKAIQKEKKNDKKTPQA